MEHVLSVRNLTKTYGSTTALNHISMDLHPGIYGLLGHNGAGKSTLLNILTTTLSYDEGEVLYDGKPIRELGESYRNILGYMPQQQILRMDLNVESFLYYMCAMKEVEASREKIMSLLKKVNLYDVRKKDVSSLSGGMKQRLLIAQALLNEPQVLLLDEPTAGLDPVERMHFRDLTASIAEDRIIIIATHVISDVEMIGNEMIMMRKGNIAAFGNTEDLLHHTRVQISVHTPEELKKLDPSARLLGRQYINGSLYTRFLSEQKIGEAVPASLDDAYLYYLG